MSRNLCFVICFASLIVFERTSARITDERAHFREHLGTLYAKKGQLIKQKQHLLDRLNSLSDPAYVELILKERLGVVPEGEIKVVLR